MKTTGTKHIESNGKTLNNRSAMIKRLKRRRAIVLSATILIFLLLIAGLTTGGIFIYKNVTLTKIDLRDYTNLTYSGYNEEGILHAEIKDDGMYKDFFETVDITITPNGSLSNGEEVELIYTYDKELAKEQKLWVSGTEKTVDMHGLPEAKQVSYDELFQNAKVTWEGISPEVVVTVENTSQEDFLKTIQFQVKGDKEFFAKDDIVVVEAVFDEEQAKKKGYIIESGDNGYQKEIVIDNVDEYLTDASDLTEEDIKQLDQNARTLFGDANEFGLRIFCEAHLIPTYVNGNTTFEWTNPQLISVYFNVLTDQTYLGQMGTRVNDVKFVYDAAITQSDGVTSPAEAVVRYDNLIRRADGTIDLKIDSGRIISASGSDKNIKKMVSNQEEEEYTSTKLNS